MFWRHFCASLHVGHARWRRPVLNYRIPFESLDLIINYLKGGPALTENWARGELSISCLISQFIMDINLDINCFCFKISYAKNKKKIVWLSFMKFMPFFNVKIATVKVFVRFWVYFLSVQVISNCCWYLPVKLMLLLSPLTSASTTTTAATTPAAAAFANAASATTALAKF